MFEDKEEQVDCMTNMYRMVRDDDGMANTNRTVNHIHRAIRALENENYVRVALELERARLAAEALQY